MYVYLEVSPIIANKVFSQESKDKIAAIVSIGMVNFTYLQVFSHDFYDWFS